MVKIVAAILFSGGLIAFAILYSTGNIKSPFPNPEWKNKLEMRLKDSESVQYRNVVVSPVTGWVCGEVRAKNSFGAYVGWKKFMVRPPIDLPTIKRENWIVEIEGDYAAVLVGCG